MTNELLIFNSLMCYSVWIASMMEDMLLGTLAWILLKWIPWKVLLVQMEKVGLIRKHCYFLRVCNNIMKTGMKLRSMWALSLKRNASFILSACLLMEHHWKILNFQIPVLQILEMVITAIKHFQILMGILQVTQTLSLCHIPTSYYKSPFNFVSPPPPPPQKWSSSNV